MLTLAGKTEAQIDKILLATAGREEQQILPPTDRALLAYIDKLTRTPGAMDKTDAESLRMAGFDDAAIHDAAAVCGYFAFVNRLALGLGVELEEGRSPLFSQLQSKVKE